MIHNANIDANKADFFIQSLKKMFQVRKIKKSNLKNLVPNFVSISPTSIRLQIYFQMIIKEHLLCFSIIFYCIFMRMIIDKRFRKKDKIFFVVLKRKPKKV